METPIAKLQARHNCSEAKKKYSQEENGLRTCLYLEKGADVMLTSNLWTPVGLYNGARGKVMDFVYMNSDGPQSQNFPEAVVVQFSHLYPGMPDFTEYYSRSVDIPTITDEWTKPSGNGVFTRTQFSLNLSWAFTIHKSQGKTLERLVIYLGSGEKYSGLKLGIYQESGCSNTSF